MTRTRLRPVKAGDGSGGGDASVRAAEEREGITMMRRCRPESNPAAGRSIGAPISGSSPPARRARPPDRRPGRCAARAARRRAALGGRRSACARISTPNDSEPAASPARSGIVRSSAASAVSWMNDPAPASPPCAADRSSRSRRSRRRRIGPGCAGAVAQARRRPRRGRQISVQRHVSAAAREGRRLQKRRQRRESPPLPAELRLAVHRQDTAAVLTRALRDQLFDRGAERHKPPARGASQI